MRVGLLVLLGVIVASAQGQPSRVIALVGGTVVDVSAFGPSPRDLADAAVVVENGRITAVGSRRSTVVPRGAEVIDATGKFIVPGLHDVFSTIDNQAYANALLYMGVTAIVGLDEPGPNTRRGALFTKANPSPRIYRLAALQGYDGSGLTPPPATVADLLERGRKRSVEELITLVDDLARDGNKVLLLHYTLVPEQLRAVAAHARKIGLAT